MAKEKKEKKEKKVRVRLPSVRLRARGGGGRGRPGASADLALRALAAAANRNFFSPIASRAAERLRMPRGPDVLRRGTEGMPTAPPRVRGRRRRCRCRTFLRDDGLCFWRLGGARYTLFRVESRECGRAWVAWQICGAMGPNPET